MGTHLNEQPQVHILALGRSPGNLLVAATRNQVNTLRSGARIAMLSSAPTVAADSRSRQWRLRQGVACAQSRRRSPLSCKPLGSKEGEDGGAGALAHQVWGAGSRRQPTRSIEL